MHGSLAENSRGAIGFQRISDDTPAILSNLIRPVAKSTITELIPLSSRALPPSHARLHLLDEVRGFAVLCMVFFHAFYTMSMSFDMQAGTALLDFFTPAEPFFAGLFILLSGFCCRLSRSNAKRGAILLCIALALTAATLLLEWLGMQGTVIWFGILHLLSLGMLTFALARPLLDRIHPVIGLLICILLFVLFYPISQGENRPARHFFRLPAGCFLSIRLACPAGHVLEQLLFGRLLSLLPWLFLFLAGSFLGVAAQKEQCPRFFYRMHIRPLAIVGRHALIVYIAHQPVIFALLWIAVRIIS